MKELWERLKTAAFLKKYKVPLLVLSAGVVLMLLPAAQQEERSATEQGGYESFSLEETERRMEEILGRIQGTGKLKLMLTLKSGPQLQLAEDIDQARDGESASLRSETVTMNRGSGNGEDVFVTSQVYPIYQGALVVCQGADQAAVRLAVTEAVAALTGLSSDRITVVKSNS